MVRAGKNEFGAAGDGTELPDHQSIPVDGVVIENIVLLKIQRVVYKVVVHGVSAHRDAGGFDHGVQVNRLLVPCTRINLFCRNRHHNFLLM